MAGDPQEFHDDYFPEEDSSKVWKWEIWPHPYTSDYDYMVTDSDDEARDAILHAAEMHLWDSNDGEERTLKVVHNNEVSGAGTASD